MSTVEVVGNFSGCSWCSCRRGQALHRASQSVVALTLECVTAKCIAVCSVRCLDPCCAWTMTGLYDRVLRTMRVR